MFQGARIVQRAFRGVRGSAKGTEVCGGGLGGERWLWALLREMGYGFADRLGNVTHLF